MTSALSPAKQDMVSKTVVFTIRQIINMRSCVKPLYALIGGALLVSCGGGEGPIAPAGRQTVAGNMSFLLGATSAPSSLAITASQSQVRRTVPFPTLVANDEYVVSPRKAKITFASVTFRGASGNVLGESSLDACVVTYDRSLPSGSTLSNCPVAVPVGDIYEIAVSYNKAIQLIVSDGVIGIYSNPSSPTGFSTSAPAGGASFVPFTIVIGDNNPTRATSIILSKPIAIGDGSTPVLYITTDMIHTFHMRVDNGGNTLSGKAGGNEAIALFGGLTPGSSKYYSNANTIESFKVGSVQQGFIAVRLFHDQTGAPLFLMGPNGCGIDAQGVESPKAAWASPPAGGTIGGWLGRDSNNILAWAMPTTSSYSTYASYFVMAEQTVTGQTTSLMCKATPSPPAPPDGKTYASGAPVMPAPDTKKTLTLLAK